MKMTFSSPYHHNSSTVNVRLKRKEYSKYENEIGFTLEEGTLSVHQTEKIWKQLCGTLKCPKCSTSVLTCEDKYHNVFLCEIDCNPNTNEHQICIWRNI